MSDMNMPAAPAAAPTGALHWSSAEFDAKLKEAGDKPVIVDFYAEWCGPCKLAAPIIDKLSTEYATKAVIAKVDTDENNDLAAKYGVMSIPTVVVFKKQGDAMVEVDRKIGFPGEPGYRQMIDKVVGAAA
jgi:thioredoxin 1